MQQGTGFLIASAPNAVAIQQPASNHLMGKTDPQSASTTVAGAQMHSSATGLTALPAAVAAALTGVCLPEPEEICPKARDWGKGGRWIEPWYNAAALATISQLTDHWRHWALGSEGIGTAAAGAGANSSPARVRR